MGLYRCHGVYTRLLYHFFGDLGDGQDCNSFSICLVSREASNAMISYVTP